MSSIQVCNKQPPLFPIMSPRGNVYPPPMEHRLEGIMGHGPLTEGYVPPTGEYHGAWSTHGPLTGGHGALTGGYQESSQSLL